MKIEQIELFVVRIPLIPITAGGIAPYRGHNLPPGQGLTSAASCIYKVVTDDGLVGWGETNPVVNFSFHRALFEEVLRPALIGSDPLNREEICRKISPSFAPPLFSRSLLAGIDMACWDILGQAANRPVYDLLGGMIRERVGIAYCIGIFEEEATREKILSIREQGFPTLKIKGGGDVVSDVQRTFAAREHTGPEMNLRIDMNQGYDFTQAARFLNSTESLDLEYIEQPLPVNQFDAMAALRSRCKTPVAINEDCYIPHNLFEFIRQKAIDLAVVDLDPLGGISALVKVANYCAEAGLPLAHHCGFDMGIKLAAILQVYAARPALSHAVDSTYMGHADDILVEPIQIVEGHYLVPQGPGLGVTVDEDKIRRYSLESAGQE
ncbi:MAG: mandelate racemase/muconate lactonizing enzyme family protein [Anaerolineaceae bacterium]|nr:mandelate racemase/muconate lactonizing enzyme family protein [Anaerolineaceae bacterium]